MTPAAIYARSSRDRAEVSIAAQLHELEAIARARGLQICATFEDAVESGATVVRPGFLNLGQAIRDRKRGWSVLLVYDTSRIARRRYIAQAFKHECRKHGVTIQYAKVPADIDPISELVLDAVFEAMDEVHSLMSREKAVAGQRENVRRGFRAGGRAPIGYQLEHVPTGALREGRPVTKSRLVPSDQAPAIARYLKARARGDARSRALDDTGIDLAKASLVGLEWNALVYAGHTVWNRHLGRRDRGAGQAKRRPRAEWTIQRDTHTALISDLEAESILERLASSEIGEKVSAGKRAASNALLSGLLVTPEGEHWRAAGRHYRLEGTPARNVQRAKIEQIVLEQVEADIETDSFIEGLLEAMRAERQSDKSLPLRRQIEKLRREREKASRLALTDDASPAWATLVAERDAQILALEHELEVAGRQPGLAEAVRQLTPDAARNLVRGLDDPALLLQNLVARVTLDRALVGRVMYWKELGASRGVCMASPRPADRCATFPGAWFRIAS